MMNRRLIYVVACAICALIVLAMPAHAVKPTYTARGTIETYVDVWSSEITWGRWNVELRDGEIDYQAKFIEKNLDAEIEDSPVGSTDTFWHSFTTEGYSLEGDTIRFWGTLHVEKLWSRLDGGTEKVSWDINPVVITVDPLSFYLDVPPPEAGPGWFDQDWDRVGTTEEIKQ